MSSVAVEIDAPKKLVNRSHLVASMEKLGLKVDRVAPTDSLIKQLVAHFSKTAKRGELATCDHCKGDSPMALDVCPYCGIVEQPKQDAKTDAKTDAKPNGGNGAPAPGAIIPAPPAPPAPTTSVVVPSPALDAAVARVRELKSGVAASWWYLGDYIRKEIFDKQLWKQRLVDGKSPYKSGGFDAFVRAELGMTSKHAYRLMDVSRAFTEPQVKQFGVTKLGIIVTVPKEAQPKLLAAASTTSKRDLEKAAKVERDKAGVKKRETGRKKTPEGGRTAVTKQITVATLCERKRVKLFAKAHLKDERPAKKLADLPVGHLELANDVVMTFAVQQTPAGELVLIVEAKRV